MRERPKDKARLEHILAACAVIEEAIQKYGLDGILAEPILKYGLVKQVEIIGEAVYKLSKEFKEQNPVLPWQKIEDMRHVLVHDYYQISVPVLRMVAERDVPELRPKIQKLYDSEK